MITLQEVMELGQYKITGSSRFLWKCYGYDARIIDFNYNHFDNNCRNVIQDVDFSVIFDTKTQTVYEVSIHDYVKENYYKMVNPDYFHKLVEESQEKSIDYRIVFEDVKYNFIETKEDFVSKASAIINNEPYDEQIEVPLEITEEDFLKLSILAHEHDLSINKYVEKIILKMINKDK